MDLKVKGRQPEARSFHTISAVDNRVVVIGGRGLQNQHFKEIHIYDAGIHLSGHVYHMMSLI